MTQQYTVKIRNLYKDQSREVVLEHDSAQLAHKKAYMSYLKLDEEIQLVEDLSGKTVYDIHRGFYTS